MLLLAHVAAALLLTVALPVSAAAPVPQRQETLEVRGSRLHVQIAGDIDGVAPMNSSLITDIQGPHRWRP